MLFEKEKIFCIITESEIRLEDKNKVIYRHELIGNPIKNGIIDDEQSFSYQLLKVLGRINKRADLYIEVSLISNVFRSKKLDNSIDENDIESYLKYNLDEIFPYKSQEYELNYIFRNNILYLFGINKEVLSIIMKVIEDEALKKVYISPPLFGFFNDNNNFKVQNYNILNIEKDMMEFFHYKSQKINYFSMSLNHRIDFEDFDINDLDNQLKIGEVKKNFSKIIQSFNLKEKNDIEILLTGDSDLIPIWIKILETTYDSFRFNKLNKIRDRGISKSKNYILTSKKNKGNLFFDYKSYIYVLVLILITSFLYFDDRENKLKVNSLNTELEELMITNNKLNKIVQLEDEKKLKENQEEINSMIVENYKGQVALRELINEIIDNQTKDIYITGITYNQEKFQIEGQSLDRQTIDNFIGSFSNSSYRLSLKEVINNGNYYVYTILVGVNND